MFNLLQSRTFTRPVPFTLQQFLRDQVKPIIMADTEKKVRLSGESPRVTEPGTTLPSVNVAAEKPEPPKSSLHPSVYVVYVPGCEVATKLANEAQNMDLFQWWCHSVQQVAS